MIYRYSASHQPEGNAPIDITGRPARGLALALTLVVGLSLLGCALQSKPDWQAAFGEGLGPVEWSYASPSGLPVAATPVPARLRILDLKSETPSGGMGAAVGQVFITIWPVIGAFTPAMTFDNRIDVTKGGDFGWDLQDDEIERILASELEKVGLFEGVQVEGPEAALDLGGRYNCQKSTRVHLSGLGFAYVVLLLPMTVLPMSSEWYECEAHFSIHNGSQELFAKSYESRFGGARWPGSDVGGATGFGKHVTPDIVQKFVEDLLALDRAHWTRGE